MRSAVILWTVAVLARADTVWDWLIKEPTTRDFVDLLQEPGLEHFVSLLQHGTGITVFVPSNGAFARHEFGNWTDLDYAIPVLSHHFLHNQRASALSSSSCEEDNYELSQLNSWPPQFNNFPEGLFIFPTRLNSTHRNFVRLNDGHSQQISINVTRTVDPFTIRTRNLTATMTMTSGRTRCCTNGQAHVVDRVLLPPLRPSESLGHTPIDLFMTFKALQLSGLLEDLDNLTDVTFLAPSEAAWGAANKALGRDLFDNATELRSILIRHIVTGRTLSAEMRNNLTFTSLDGSRWPVDRSASGFWRVGRAPIRGLEYPTDSGVFYIMDGVLGVAALPAVAPKEFWITSTYFIVTLFVLGGLIWILSTLYATWKKKQPLGPPEEPSPEKVIAHYFIGRVWQDVTSLAPVCSYMMAFQIILLQSAMTGATSIMFGLVSTVLGMNLFVHGLVFGLMPVGQYLGELLPSTVAVPWVLVICGIIGVGSTFAEPAIGALESIGLLMDPHKFPFLYAMLIVPRWRFILVMAVAVGVGIASVLGTLKFVHGWSNKVLAIGSLIPCLIMTIIMNMDESLNEMSGLAWDCGAVTTGPVTVPLVLALGIGVAKTVSSKKKMIAAAAAASAGADLPPDGEDEENAFAGFGIVTLASLVPVFVVQLLAVLMWATHTREEIRAQIDEHHRNEEDPDAWDKFSTTSPWFEIIMTSRALLPLAIFVVLVCNFVLKKKLPTFNVLDAMEMDNHIKREGEGELVQAIDDQDEPGRKAGAPDRVMPVLTGGYVGNRENFRITRQTILKSVSLNRNILKIGLWPLCYLGRLLFFFGIFNGLQPLASQTGKLIPTAYDSRVSDEPLFSREVGLVIIYFFTYMLGYVATLGEPALGILGMRVEQLTAGSFKKSMLIFAVCCGVGAGILLGVIRILYKLNFMAMMLPLYAVAVALSIPSSEDFVSVAWDCAGVTTGEITVPLVLAMGVSLGDAEDEIGFGILALASVCPIVSVLGFGLILRLQKHLASRRKDGELTTGLVSDDQ